MLPDTEWWVWSPLATNWSAAAAWILEIITREIRTKSSLRHFMGTPDTALATGQTMLTSTCGDWDHWTHFRTWSSSSISCHSFLTSITRHLWTTFTVHKQCILRKANYLSAREMTIKSLARVLISSDSTVCVYLGHVWLGAECRALENITNITWYTLYGGRGHEACINPLNQMTPGPGRGYPSS